MSYPGQGKAGDNLVRISYYNGCVYVVDVLASARIKRYVNVTKGLNQDVKEDMYFRFYYKN